MPDFGRIDRAFWRHPKAEQCSLAALGLWTMANAWCRDNRRSGFISCSKALELARGSADLIGELVGSRLWVAGDDGYQFNDWEEWNPDEKANTVAAKLVYKTIPQSHPDAVRQQLTGKVHELLTSDGVSPAVIEKALSRWLDKPKAGVALLPFIVSDLIRENKTEFRELLLECWHNCDVDPLIPLGFMFVPPPIPADMSDVQDIRTFVKGAKRAYIEQLKNDFDLKRAS